MSSLFSHVTIGANDLAKTKAFYDALLRPLGIVCRAEYPEALAYGLSEGPTPIWIVRPLDRKPATAGNGITIGFEAESRPAVDAAYKGAMAAGGRDEGAPGVRENYSPNYYGAYVRDPDGTKICIVCHKAP
jgi:catechol 2,3-dioxygenase-like lactoylglutathione lyase family enzyme